jgi:hypothetical protein
VVSVAPCHIDSHLLTMTLRRAMNDEDGPAVAEAFYGKLFESEVISADAIPRALDHATKMLREKKVPPERWATFMHAGA